VVLARFGGTDKAPITYSDAGLRSSCLVIQASRSGSDQKIFPNHSVVLGMEQGTCSFFPKVGNFPTNERPDRSDSPHRCGFHPKSATKSVEIRRPTWHIAYSYQAPILIERLTVGGRNLCRCWGIAGTLYRYILSSTSTYRGNGGDRFNVAVIPVPLAIRCPMIESYQLRSARCEPTS
jgi:hypothetical protein